MPKDTTPADWPQPEEEGMLDALWTALTRWSARPRSGPRDMEAPLTKGACLSLARTGRLSVRCLEGNTWATGDFGRDIVLTAGAEIEINQAAGVVFTALSPSARLRLRWR